MRRLTAALTLALLSACGTTPSAKSNSNDVDPAITSALADPLMADPQLDGRSNNGALRPADQPYQAMVPPGSPDPLRGDAAPTVLARIKPMLGSTFSGCDLGVRYSYGWAARLSPDLTLPPEARVAEAAGSDATGCGLRLVAYAAPIGPEAAADAYRRVAKAGGYALSERKLGPATIITATRAADGAAFVASVTAPDGGSAVDLATNRGR
jgi:hypothetical protein